jgi:hypothetical protein
MKTGLTEDQAIPDRCPHLLFRKNLNKPLDVFLV